MSNMPDWLKKTRKVGNAAGAPSNKNHRPYLRGGCPCIGRQSEPGAGAGC